MAPMADTIQCWQMVQPTSKNKETGEILPGRLERTTIPMPALREGEVVVEIAGCGVCHTDLGYFYDGVPTVSKPPLTLGHEISGTVVGGVKSMVGKEVIIPAVMPCGNCPICDSGRGNRCLAQKMPGNSLDNLGGFADHIVVPAADLCVIDDRGGTPLSHYAVVADAVTTPYQAAMRANISPNDNVLVLGVTGGVGVYMAQIAKALGAKTVVGIARNEEKLKRSLEYGADYTINSKGKDIKSLKEEFKSVCKEAGVPHNFGWKIFECTGTEPGQEIALSMLSFVGKLVGCGIQPDDQQIYDLQAHGL